MILKPNSEFVVFIVDQVRLSFGLLVTDHLDWCANKSIPESTCVQNGAWGISPEPGSCADSCCRAHDYCCGKGTDRPACNKAIVNCIAGSGCYTSVCGALVWAALKAVNNWCCGSPCPTELIESIEQKLLALGHI